MTAAQMVGTKEAASGNNTRTSRSRLSWTAPPGYLVGIGLLLSPYCATRESASKSRSRWTNRGKVDLDDRHSSGRQERPTASTASPTWRTALLLLCRDEAATPRSPSRIVEARPKRAPDRWRRWPAVAQAKHDPCDSNSGAQRLRSRDLSPYECGAAPDGPLPSTGAESTARHGTLHEHTSSVRSHVRA